jgi:hypothetical protein
MPKTKTIVMPRNAKNGQIVTKEYAEKHPSTTTIEKRKVVK